MPQNARSSIKAKTITPQRKTVLKALRQLELEEGHPPTVRELMRYLGFNSTASVYTHLEALKDQKLVRHRPNCARGWQAEPYSKLQPFLKSQIA